MEESALNQVKEVFIPEDKKTNKLNVISSETKVIHPDVTKAYDKITGKYWYNNKKLWFVLRSLGVLFILFLLIALLLDFRYKGVSAANFFWFTMVNVMILIIFFVPMFWRNICPLSTVNLFNFNFFHKKKLSKEGVKANLVNGAIRNKIYMFLTRKGVLVSALLFWIIVPMRIFLFHDNNFTTFIILISIFSIAFIMGFFFPVKSGWCTSVCPVFSVEKTYGINPALYVRNQRCDYYNKEQKKINSCSACSYNCMDVTEPEACYFMEGCSKPFHDTMNASMRKIFISAFPGFLLGYMFFTPGFDAVAPFLGLNFILKIKELIGTSPLMIYLGIFVSMLITYFVYNFIKHLFRIKIKKWEGELNLEKPSRKYSLWKRRLDLIFISFTLNFYWIGSAYGMIFYVFALLFNLNNAVSFTLYFLLIILVLAFSLLGIYKGWNETFMSGEHNPSWW